METVLNALKCKICREILSQPVLLPCGHSVCKSHTQIDQARIKCLKCNMDHPNGAAFVVSEDLSDMIQVQLDSFDFGLEHKEARKACNDLREQIEKNDAFLFMDFQNFSHEKIGELKNKVLLQREQLKLRIDENAQELIDELEEFEKLCCCDERTRSNDANLFDSSRNRLRAENDAAKTCLHNWTHELNKLKLDEAKWRHIKQECDKRLNDLRTKTDRFQTEFLAGEFVDRKSQICYFAKADVDLLLINYVRNEYI